MDMKLQFLGGAENVTGSCHLLSVQGMQILIDCGLYQERELQSRNYAPFPFDPGKIDCVVLTHAHLDHCGLLPRLTKEGFRGPVYATPATADLAEIVMRDAAHIQAEDAAYKRRRHEREGRTSKHGYDPIYTAEDVDGVVAAWQKIRFDTRRKIGTGVAVELQRAGHILGAASVRISVTRHGHERRILFSGDVGRRDVPILQDPRPFDGAEIVCMESTYGNRTHKRAVPIPDMLARVITATATAGGNVVIPSFAIERTQELLYRIGALLREERIPAVPVFVDSPMATRVTDVFRQHPELFDEETRALIASGALPCDFPGLYFTASVDESKALNTRPGTSIIIAGSGMCTGGRIKHHLRNNLERPESTILFVGYQAHGTLGRYLLEGNPQVRLFNERKNVLARIEKINGMSAHADQGELVEWLQSQGSTPETCFTIHGESNAAGALAARITRDLAIPCRAARYLEEVQL